MSAPAFPGFNRDLITFLQGLRDHNEKAWFDAHRQDYDSLFMESARAFVTAMAAALPAVAPNLRAEPKVNGSIRRINRDIRFSKDKRPYNTMLHLVFWTANGKPTNGPGLHVAITPTGFGLGAGIWGMEPAALDAYRTAVADDKSGAALAAAIATAEKAGYTLDPPHLKRVPPDYDPDSPRADLLRHKGLVMRKENPHPDALFGAQAVAVTIGEAKPLLPMLDWLGETLPAP